MKCNIRVSSPYNTTAGISILNLRRLLELDLRPSKGGSFGASSPPLGLDRSVVPCSLSSACAVRALPTGFDMPLEIIQDRLPPVSLHLDGVFGFGFERHTHSYLLV